MALESIEIAINEIPESESTRFEQNLELTSSSNESNKVSRILYPRCKNGFFMPGVGWFETPPNQ